MKKLHPSLTFTALFITACAHNASPVKTGNNQQISTNNMNQKVQSVTSDSRCTQDFVNDWNQIANRSTSLVATLSKANNDSTTSESQADIQKVNLACATFISAFLVGSNASNDAATPVSCYAVQNNQQVEVTSDSVTQLCTTVASLSKSLSSITPADSNTTTGDSPDITNGASGTACSSDIIALNQKLRQDFKVLNTNFKTDMPHQSTSSTVPSDISDQIKQGELVETECDQLADAKVKNLGCVMPSTKKGHRKTLTSGMLSRLCLQASYERAYLEVVQNPNAVASAVTALPQITAIAAGALVVTGTNTASGTSTAGGTSSDSSNGTNTNSSTGTL